ncbi:protein phosphatase 2C 57 isoform X1 [Senna tora]|uniref:Protein phosphatase 2C 57 isoform X1 n=1 Tax=Senna tora TaxID=362788 RepID=A0A834TL07_9FABA|nr:protein phosphatase 2C 57 isoform X1 [Senna tora]
MTSKNFEVCYCLKDSPKANKDLLGMITTEEDRLSKRGGKKSTVEQIKEVGDDDNDDVRLLGFFFGEVVLEAIESGKNGGDELYKECLAAPQGGLLLARTYFQTIKAALQEAFANADASLLKR